MNPIQALINEAVPGSTVQVPPGSYTVDDAVYAPILLKSNITLDLTGSSITAKPTDKPGYNIISISDCQNVFVLNGNIVGDRNTHTGSTGEWGFGIRIGGGSHNIAILRTNISDCWGDGVYIEDAYSVTISNVFSTHNRRQGLSATHVDGLRITGCIFSNNGGTPPGDGIDLECDTDAQRIANVTIGNCNFADNAGSGIAVGSAGTYSNINIMPNNTFDLKTQPIWTAGNAGPLGTPWWAFLINRTFGKLPSYRYWGYKTSWFKA